MQFLSLLQCKHGVIDTSRMKKLTFFDYLFEKESIIENINIK